MLSKVDETKKITISLGGACRLRCKHCYITVPQFKFQRRLKVEEVERILNSKKGRFSAICISGDTDPLLDQKGFTSLLHMCSTKFSDCHILFTTRLLPEKATLDAIRCAGDLLQENKKLIFPAVSFATYKYPNNIEDDKQVPSTKKRIELVHDLSDLGFPVFSAMRPTMPFAITPKDEVIQLIKELSPASAAILGEVFIDDFENTISARLNLPSAKKEHGEMTFLEQPKKWSKAHYHDEIEFAKEVSRRHKVAFFLRSMSAVNYIERIWDFENKNIEGRYFEEDGEYDLLLP